MRKFNPHGIPIPTLSAGRQVAIGIAKKSMRACPRRPVCRSASRRQKHLAQVGLLALSLFCLAGMQAHGQEKRPDNFSISGGMGVFYYYNTLKTPSDRVVNEPFCLSGRLMWEPEHRLSLGGETGYYTLYTVKIDSGKSNAPIGEARLSAIPINLCFRMRITRHIYFTGGQGMSVLISRITSLGSTIQSTQLSLADAQLSVVYRIPVGDRVRIESELKYLHFGKTQDFGFSLQAVATYTFRFKK